MVWAALDNEDTKALELIKAGAEVNAEVNSELHYSVLSYCAVNPYKNRISHCLLEYGADCTAYSNNSVSPLESCFIGNNVALAKQIIEIKDTDAFYREYWRNSNLLVAAIEYNSLRAVNLLIEQYKKNKHIFMAASLLESREFIHALIEADNVDMVKTIDAEIMQGDNENPVKDLKDYLLLFVMRKKSKSKLKGKDNLCGYLLQQRGINLLVVDNKDINTFLYGLRTGNVELIESLLAINPEIINEQQARAICPLKEALMNSNYYSLPQIIQILLKHGSSTRFRDATAIRFRSTTALHMAIINNNTDAARLLVDHDVSLVNVCDYKGETSIFKAILVDNKELVQLLLNNGASIDIINKSGDMPIMLARLYGHFELEQMLMDHKIKQQEKLVINY